jgi:hypothetical protein
MQRTENEISDENRVPALSTTALLKAVPMPAATAALKAVPALAATAVLFLVATEATTAAPSPRSGFTADLMRSCRALRGSP